MNFRLNFLIAQLTFIGFLMAGDQADFEKVRRERAQAAVLGLVLGDALGTPYEFLCGCRGTRKVGYENAYTLSPFYYHVLENPTSSLRGGRPGDYTDDTSMALCLLDALNQQKVDKLTDYKFAQALMDRFYSWMNRGDFSVSPGTPAGDVGYQTRQCLKTFKLCGNPFQGPKKDSGNSGSGNGGIMRLSPVVLHCYNNYDGAMHYAELQSVTTHATPSCRDAAKFMTAIMMTAINSKETDPLKRKEEALFNHKFRGFESKAIRDMALNENDIWRTFSDGDAMTKGSLDQNGHLIYDLPINGWVVASLRAALWAVRSTNNFGDAIIAATNLLDDADTVAAITGQIAGAIYGPKGINEFLEKCKKNKSVVKVNSGFNYKALRNSISNFDFINRLIDPSNFSGNLDWDRLTEIKFGEVRNRRISNQALCLGGGLIGAMALVGGAALKHAYEKPEGKLSEKLSFPAWMKMNFFKVLEFLKLKSKKK